MDAGAGYFSGVPILSTYRSIKQYTCEDIFVYRLAGKPLKLLISLTSRYSLIKSDMFNVFKNLLSKNLRKSFPRLNQSLANANLPLVIFSNKTSEFQDLPSIYHSKVCREFSHSENERIRNYWSQLCHPHTLLRTITNWFKITSFEILSNILAVLARLILSINIAPEDCHEHFSTFIKKIKIDIW